MTEQQIGIDDNQRLGDELDRLLRLRTYPVAVKMLRSAGEVPAEAIRPVRDLGHQFNVCQAFALSRRGAQTIALLKEDNWCPGPVAGFGLEHPTEFFLQGQQQENTFRNLDVSREWCQSLPRFDVGEFVGIVSAPLASATFEPDVVMLWVNAAQLAFLLMAHNWSQGKDVVSRLSARGACIFEIVPALQTECQLSVPCFGERQRAMTQDDELVFNIAQAKLADVLEGLRHFKSIGYGLPIKFTMLPEYGRSANYNEWAQLLRMEPLNRSP